MWRTLVGRRLPRSWRRTSLCDSNSGKHYRNPKKKQRNKTWDKQSPTSQAAAAIQDRSHLHPAWEQRFWLKKGIT